MCVCVCVCVCVCEGGEGGGSYSARIAYCCNSTIASVTSEASDCDKTAMCSKIAESSKHTSSATVCHKKKQARGGLNRA